MKLRSMFVGALLAVTSLAIAAPVQAAYIIGHVNTTTGNDENDGVIVESGNVDWTQPRNDPPNTDPTYGEFFFSGIRTGSFSVLQNPTLGGGPFLIQDLSGDSTDGNYTPVGFSAGISDFLQFTGGGSTWQFVETFLQPGNLDPTTPFVFSADSPTTSSVKISIFGYAYDINTPTQISTWTYIASAQFTESLGSLLARAAAGPIETSWSGSLDVQAVPEPATLLTFGLGAMYLARRRRNQKKS